jgi:hypothetical protein
VAALSRQRYALLAAAIDHIFQILFPLFEGKALNQSTKNDLSSSKAVFVTSDGHRRLAPDSGCGGVPCVLREIPGLASQGALDAVGDVSVVAQDFAE